MDISKISDKNQIAEAKLNSAQAAKSRVVKSSDSSNQKVAGVELGTGANSSENVKWSDDAQVASEAVAFAKAAPDVRSDRIAQLKLAIQNGTYKPDANAIAEKMIQSSMEEALLTRKA
jgi:negative regulator of flagellin synthesis FlgM